MTFARVDYINKFFLDFLMQRTISLVFPKYKELCETIYSYNFLVNMHISECLCTQTISKVKLHYSLYSNIRKTFSDFPSALIQCARDNAVEIMNP